ncbi:MAG: IS66 family transposase [Sulfuricaulis sp.]|nr:IS66 family transposase [Sulfuricaulis sp.]
MIAFILGLRAENAALKEEIARLQEEMGKKGDPPSWVKRNAPPREEKPRKQRDHGHSRRCAAVPDATQEHAVEFCPDCGNALAGGWEYCTRESIVFPKEPVRIVRHVSIARRCGVCGQTVIGRPDPALHGLVGKHRVDARGMALIACWHTVCRMPLRVIQQLLRQLYRCSLSPGELRYVLDAVAEQGQRDYDGLRDLIRGSPVVHQDETGWRENGQNGYVWAAVTDAVRYFERHGTRSGEVPKALLGENFCGVVVCDGYGGYDGLDCQLQRCWTHLLRKGHELKARHPDATDAHGWADGVRAIYLEATALVASPGYAALPETVRESRRLAFQRRMLAFAQPALASTIQEEARLAKFITRKINELFVFVHYPEVPSENNPAERAIRPLVITRKVCGGTRSARGSQTKMILLSLLHTAQLREMDPIASLERMLLGSPMFPASV